MSIADRVPSATVLQISNNTEVQVRIILSSSEHAVKFTGLPGCTEALSFAYPPVGGVANPQQLCLSVETPHLLNVCRFLLSHPQYGRIHQIYDFFNYD